MIEMRTIDDERSVVIRVSGTQPATEFADVAVLFAQRYRHSSDMRVLFDWTELSNWDDNIRASYSCRRWSDAASLIVRSAIVHNRRWNRHAAVLAAVIRRSRGRVRSWRTTELENAVVWLNVEWQLVDRKITPSVLR